MEIGILTIHRNNRLYLDSRKNRPDLPIRSGQYIYINVDGSWVPVVVNYSPKRHRWVFKYLENMPVNGQESMIR